MELTQVTNSPVYPYKPYYQLLMRFALMMVLVLLGCGLWATLQTSTETQNIKMKSDLEAAVQYYDKVQGQAGIIDLRYLSVITTVQDQLSANCPVGWEQIDLYNYPGSKKGMSPLNNINRWAGNRLCVKRLVRTPETLSTALTYFLKDESDQCNGDSTSYTGTLATTTTPGIGSVSGNAPISVPLTQKNPEARCGRCECYKGNPYNAQCPYTNFNMRVSPDTSSFENNNQWSDPASTAGSTTGQYAPGTIPAGKSGFKKSTVPGKLGMPTINTVPTDEVLVNGQWQSCFRDAYSHLYTTPYMNANGKYANGKSGDIWPQWTSPITGQISYRRMVCQLFNQGTHPNTIPMGTNTNNYLVDIEAHLFSNTKPCKSTLQHGSSRDSTWQDLLKGNYNGCGTTLGADNTASRYTGDQLLVREFFNDNKQTATYVNKPTTQLVVQQGLTQSLLGEEMWKTLVTDPSQDDNILLYGRYQISTACSKTCRDFRFGTSTTKLIDGVVSTQSSLRTIAYTAGLGSLVALGWLIYVIMNGSKASQASYYWLYIFGLSLCFILAILLGVKYGEVAFLQKNSETFAVASKCILDPEWKKVPEIISSEINFETIANWTIVFTCLFTLCFLLGVMLLCYVSQQLAKLVTAGPQQIVAASPYFVRQQPSMNPYGSNVAYSYISPR